MGGVDLNVVVVVESLALSTGFAPLELVGGRHSVVSGMFHIMSFGLRRVSVQ